MEERLYFGGALFLLLFLSIFLLLLFALVDCWEMCDVGKKKKKNM